MILTGTEYEPSEIQNMKKDPGISIQIISVDIGFFINNQIAAPIPALESPAVLGRNNFLEVFGTVSTFISS